MVEFFDRAEYRLFENFKAPDITDDQVIELHRQLQALDAFRVFLHKILVDGKRAEKENSAAD